MHIADLSVGNLGANAIVGGGIPIAVGAALAIKKQHRKNVAVSFFGDSASNEGTFHEALNMAAIWKLPVIFVCENNGFGISVPQWQSTAVEDISVRAKAYGIPGYTGFGNDVNEVDKLFMKAKKRALDGEGPTLLEFKTYRFRGHWTGDPEPYRTREEVKDWKENKDPLKLYKAYLLENSVATAEELEAIEKAAADKMAAAVDFALNSPEPDPAHVLDDVFFEG